MSDKTEWIRKHHANGQLLSETPYVDGKRHGLHRVWHRNGELVWVSLWNAGERVMEVSNPPQTEGKWKIR